MAGTPITNPTRELAAIMFSDIAGYTAMMGRDEQKGVRAVAAHRELLHTVLPKFNGRILSEAGDGTLTSFHSAVDAVNCARAIQSALKRDGDFSVRIGIHVGDVLFTDNTVLGDGVNVASRIHALAPPGGIYVSERVYVEIRNQPEMRAKDLGEKRLKNVEKPIRIYALEVTGPADEPRIPQITRRTTRVIAAVVVAMIIAALGYGIAKWRSSSSVPSPAPQLASQPHVIRSIAVLPLDNFSGDPNQEYFSDGLTDELTTDLATISALRVISRGSVMQFKGAHRPPTPEIAKALNVDAVVEGSVVRVGDKVRVTAQLIDAPDDKHLWAKSYERDSKDVLAMQDEIAQAIAKEINIELTPDEQAHLANSHAVNPEAHEAYLKGRYFLASFSEERVKKAIEQFEQAIKLDPNFALPYTGLADAYSNGEDWYFPATEVMPKAKAAVEKALQLDDSSAEAHASLAFIKWQYDFDWTGGEREYRRAFALNPNYAEAHHQFFLCLMSQGRFEESLAEVRRGAELDPLSEGIANDEPALLIFQGKYQAAKEGFRKALELDPSFYLPQFGLGWADLEAGKFDEAIAELEKARKMDFTPFVTGFLGYAYAAAGDRGKAQAIVAELNQMSTRRFVSPFCTAIVYLGLGDKPQALEGLEKAYEVRSQWLTFLKIEKFYDPLRSEPRFIVLLKKVGLDK